MQISDKHALLSSNRNRPHLFEVTYKLINYHHNKVEYFFNLLFFKPKIDIEPVNNTMAVLDK